MLHIMASFREKAEQCYRLARTTTTADIADRLTELALEYEAKAAIEESRNTAVEHGGSHPRLQPAPQPTAVELDSPAVG